MNDEGGGLDVDDNDNYGGGGGGGGIRCQWNNDNEVKCILREMTSASEVMGEKEGEGEVVVGGGGHRDDDDRIVTQNRLAREARKSREGWWRRFKINSYMYNM